MNFISDWLNKITVAKSSATNPKLIVTRVEKIEKHPNADRLRVVALTDGSNIYYPIVCGAFNFEVGDIVVLALPGAQIAKNIHSKEHEPFVLQKATIRGVESQGMICAAFELGLSDNLGEGILLLKNDAVFGQEFSSDLIKP